MISVRNIISAVAVCLCTALSVCAQNSSVLFVNYPQDARSFAMGATSMGLNPGLSTVVTNPASIALWGSPIGAEVSYMAINPTDIRNDVNFTVASSFGDRFGVSLFGRYSQGNMLDNQTDDYGNMYYMRESGYLAGVGLSVKIIEGLSLGINAKYIRLNKYSDEFLQARPDLCNANAFAADLSVMYTNSGWIGSVGVSNIGSKVINSTDENASGVNLPATVRLGFGYGHKWGKHSLQASAQGDYYIFDQGKYSFGAGAEYGFNDIVFVRTGYNQSTKADTPLAHFYSVGAGVAYKGFTLDLAYMLPLTEVVSGISMANTFMVSLGWRF